MRRWPPVIDGVGLWVRGEHVPHSGLGRCLLQGPEPDDGADKTVVERGSEEVCPRPEVLCLTDDDLGLGMVDRAEDRGDHPVWRCHGWERADVAADVMAA